MLHKQLFKKINFAENPAEKFAQMVKDGTVANEFDISNVTELDSP